MFLFTGYYNILFILCLFWIALWPRYLYRGMVPTSEHSYLGDALPSNILWLLLKVPTSVCSKQLHFSKMFKKSVAFE